MADIRNHIRAGAFGALALLFGASASAQDTVDWDEDASAVYTAKVVKMEWVGKSPNCLADDICLNGLWDLTLEPIEVLAGDKKVSRQTFKVIQHAPFVPGSIIVAAVQRDKTGVWHLISRTRMHRQVCFHDPDGMIWDNIADEDEVWVADHESRTNTTCMLADMP